MNEYLKYFENSMTESVDGAFKMSETVLNKVLKSSITRRDKTYKGISNYELILLIKLVQICNVRGYIEDFRLLNIKSITGCKRRNCYYILKGLENKGFIKYSKSNYAGRYNITVMDNDFTNANYKKNHYLNMNKEFFNGYYFNIFCSLSLNAKKLFLMLSYNYRLEYDYQVSFERISERLQVSKRHIKGYIAEINQILPNNTLKISDYLSTNGKKRILNMGKDNIFLRSNRDIAPNVVNHFKYKIMTKFDELGIIPGSSLNDKWDRGDKALSLATRLYNLCVEFLKKGMDINTIYEQILKQCRIDGIVQTYTFSRIREELLST